MVEIQQIDRPLAAKILNEYGDNPLLRSIDFTEAESLLIGSFYGAGCGTEMNVIDENLYGSAHLLADYLTTTDPKDISIPALLLEGSLHYSFKSEAMNPPPLTATVEAPIVSYFVPFDLDASIIYPDIATSPTSKGIVFNPVTFKEVSYRNPQMFDVILKDRERMYAMLLKWLPVNALASTSYRIARLLMARLPEVCKAEETITLTQAEIAGSLYCSRATVTKGISHLYDKEIIRPGYKEIIVNTEKLKAYIKNT